MTYHASAEWLDESRSEWRSVAPMRVARTGPAVGMGFDGCVYVAGGSPNGSSSHRTAERYDPRSGTWDALPRMSIGRGYCSGAMGISGDFYVTGGITSGPSAMEIQAKTVGGLEQTEFQAELRKLKEEERNEQAQAEEFVSQGNRLQ